MLAANRTPLPPGMRSQTHTVRRGSAPQYAGSRSCRLRGRRPAARCQAPGAGANPGNPICGVPRAAPMPVSPLSVSARISVASLLTFVPRSVRWRFSSGTGADIGTAGTLTILIGCFLPDRRTVSRGRNRYSLYSADYSVLAGAQARIAASKRDLAPGPRAKGLVNSRSPVRLDPGVPRPRLSHGLRAARLRRSPRPRS
jgi:hypothetical protein